MRILLVEDYRDLAQSLASILERNGHEVKITPSGLDGLLRVAQDSFDLALLDLEVLDLSGLGVQRAVSDFNRVPVVVMSGSGDGWRKEALRGGAMACLEKPFNLQDLLALVHSVQDGLYRPAVDGWTGNVQKLSDEELERLKSLPTAELDALPFGAICLDRQRRIVAYNAYESMMSGFSAAPLLGKPFAEVAPCSLVRNFAAALNEGFANRELDTVLRFVFPQHGAWVVVNVRFYFDHLSDRMWLFVSKRPGVAQPEVADTADALRLLDASGHSSLME